MKDLTELKKQYEALGKEIEALEKVESRPMSWEDFVNSRKLCRKHMSALELSQGFELLRDAWGGEYGRKLNQTYSVGNSYVLTFKDRETYNLFKETFADLIEEAKDLL